MCARARARVHVQEYFLSSPGRLHNNLDINFHSQTSVLQLYTTVASHIPHTVSVMKTTHISLPYSIAMHGIMASSNVAFKVILKHICNLSTFF